MVELGHQILGDLVVQQDLVDLVVAELVEDLVNQEAHSILLCMVEMEQQTQVVVEVAQEDLTHQLVEQMGPVDQVL